MVTALAIPSVENRFNLTEQFKGRVTIPDLPDSLCNVPIGPNSPDDPERFQKRDDWAEWSARVIKYRDQILVDVISVPELEQVEWWKCANDPAYFMAMYGYIHEPRKNGGRGGFSKWIPFERQVQMIRWFQWCLIQNDQNADGVESKCRDVGASWTMCLLFLHQWIFTTPFNGLMISWKEEYVDSRKPRALFWKIDKLIEYLPTFLIPPGFTRAKHRISLFLENPVNGNTITGESTNSNSGRGDRATAVLADEAAQIPDFLDVWTGMGDSTEHRFAVSTESMEKGTDFSDLRSGADAEYHPAVFTIDWWEHPLHDDEWYVRQEKRYAADPEGFKREILRDPYVDANFVYPMMRQKMPLPNLKWEPGNPLYVGIDPGFDDSFAGIWVQFSVRNNRYEVLDGYTNRLAYADFYGPILAGTFEQDKKIINGVLQESGDLVDDAPYGETELELMEWVKSVDGRRATFYGDLYGHSNNGASADTWYSVWMRDFGIIVNRDRTPAGKLSAARNGIRHLTGRRKAVRWILQNVEFADTIGARKALLALQNNRFNTPANGRIPETGMFRDATTHFTSAFEYFAANRYLQSEIQFHQDRVGKVIAETETPVQLSGPRWSQVRDEEYA